jgi:hypothetical protein
MLLAILYLERDLLKNKDLQDPYQTTTGDLSSVRTYTLYLPNSQVAACCCVAISDAVVNNLHAQNRGLPQHQRFKCLH